MPNLTVYTSNLLDVIHRKITSDEKYSGCNLAVYGFTQTEGKLLFDFQQPFNNTSLLKSFKELITPNRSNHF